MSQDIDFKQTMSNLVDSCIQDDYEKFKFKLERQHYIRTYKNKIMQSSFEKLVYEQKFKCAHSHVAMSMENGAQRFTFAKIDNNKPYFGPTGDIDNIVFVCLVLSSPLMNRQKMLQCFLSQKNVLLPNVVRAKATAEYNKLVRLEKRFSQK